MAMAEIGRAPGELRAGELGDRALGTRRLAGCHRSAGALPDVAHDLRTDIDVGDGLAHDRFFERPAPAGKVDERLHAGVSSTADHRSQ